MGRNFFLLLILIACALSLVTTRHEARQLFAAQERERALIHEYELEYDRLRSEQSRYSTQKRIQALAQARLGMQHPQAEQIRVVEMTANAATSAKVRP